MILPVYINIKLFDHWWSYIKTVSLENGLKTTNCPTFGKETKRIQKNTTA